MAICIWPLCAQWIVGKRVYHRMSSYTWCAQVRRDFFSTGSDLFLIGCAHAGGWFFGTRVGFTQSPSTTKPVIQSIRPSTQLVLFCLGFWLVLLWSAVELYRCMHRCNLHFMSWTMSAFSTPQFSKISIFVAQRPATVFTLWSSFRLLCSLPMQLLNAIWFWLCTSFCWYPSGYGALL